jgi:hypothetical protein
MAQKMLIFAIKFFGGTMGLFSKKAAPSSASPAPLAPAPAAALGLVENPKTLILSFLHECSKGTGMREFIKNYAFQPCAEQRFLVLVEMKESCARTPSSVLFARWQLFQLDAMRWATGKHIPLAGLACTFPLDKTTPLTELKARAQLQSETLSHALAVGTPTVDSAGSGHQQRAGVAPGLRAGSEARSVVDMAPESQIEVNHDDSDAAEEFFRLTQPPSQS